MCIMSGQFKAMALEIFLVLIVSVMLVPPISSASLPCQNCTAQHIRITKDAPGKCDVCWPCSSLECHEGQGPSFACGTTVYHGSQIHCVACAPGKNFSDSVGSKQCQPCGVCAGEHERVLAECTAESDVKCECEEGFYRNGTTKECLPCSSCCTEDGNIEEKCKGDGGGIGTKCKFKELQPSTCLSSSTAPETTVSDPVQKPYSRLITSSFIVTSSFLHATPTPLLKSITPTSPANSETVHIKASLASDRHSKIQGMSSTVNLARPSDKTKTTNHMTKAVVIAIWMLLVIACALVIGCVICVVKTFRSWGYLLGSIGQPIRSNDLELQARECENGQNSSSHSGVSEPLLDNEPTADATSSSLTTTVEASKTAVSSDSSNSVLVINLPEQNGTDTKLEKGIPSSLDNGPTHQGQQLRKRLASEGDDETEPCLAEIHAANQEASCSPSAEPVPIQATEDNRDYSTHITDVPEAVIWDVCMLLDVERCIDHKDYTMLASDFLRLPPQKVRTLKEFKQRDKSPSYHLLMEVFSSMKNSGTLKHLRCILERMERYDVIKVIDDWVLKKPNKLKEAPV